MKGIQYLLAILVPSTFYNLGVGGFGFEPIASTSRRQSFVGTSRNHLRWSHPSIEDSILQFREPRRHFTTTTRCATNPAAEELSSDENKADDASSSSTTTENTDDFATDYHAPVMVHECLEALLDCQRGQIRNPNIKSKKSKKRRRNQKPKDVEEKSIEESLSSNTTTVFPPLIFVDGTLGGGGHSNALLRVLKPGDVLLGCDVDPNALQTASQRLSDYMNHDGTTKPLFVPVQTNFGDLAAKLPTVKHPTSGELLLSGECKGVDGILLDLGVSSHQIDAPERGFSYSKDGPLDMRMGQNSAGGGLTAADICNEFDAAELQRIFSIYGDEPRSKTIAKAIVQNRPLHTTNSLVDAIASVTPKFAKNKRHGVTSTCARVFQSLRIVVNNEDGVLSRVLSEACPSLLRTGGRLVVMSYHSMEDRATKRIIRDGTLEKVSRSPERDLYGNVMGPPKPFKNVQKRRKASDEEIAKNPRARSAVLRVAERLEEQP